MSRIVQYYGDGAYSSTSKVSGWATICIENGEIIGSWDGNEVNSTNNRGELKAVLTALESAKTIQTGNTKVEIYTDSAYIANCFAQGWYRTWLANGWKTRTYEDVKNQDLWAPIIALYIKLLKRLDLKIYKVEAHKDNGYNNLVDKMAVAARKREVK